MSSQTRQNHILTLTKDNIVAGTNNSVLRYYFPQGGSTFSATNPARIAVAKILIYNSIYNITAALGNNTFQYVWYSAGAPVTTTVTLPDGSYSVSDLNAYLQFEMVQNGHYLVDGSGNFVYYLEFELNVSQYAVQFNAYPIPTALPAGYTNPAAITFPAVATTPQVIITANLTEFIGFAAATYPAVVQASNYSALSTTAPQVDSVSTLLIHCNIVNNRLSVPPDILYTFVFNSDFGAQTVVQPPYPLFSTVQAGQYPFVSIRITDAENNPVSIQDPNITILLTLES